MLLKRRCKVSKELTENKYGSLYVVATPIGNLQDITYRAVTILGEVDLVLSEDTRQSRKLFSHYAINTRLTSLFEHNEQSKIDPIIAKLKSGLNIALISDAGTPCVSDPGFRLVEAAVGQNIKVVPIPGASSVTALLSVSGFELDKFTYKGFMPRKKSEIDSLLSTIAMRGGKYIFLESPKRIINTLEEMDKKFYKCNIVLAREMTKVYEEFIRGSVQDVIAALKAKETVKGEITFFIEVMPKDIVIDIESKIRELLKDGFKANEISKIVSSETDKSKSEIYKEVLKIKEEGS